MGVNGGRLKTIALDGSILTASASSAMLRFFQRSHLSRARGSEGCQNAKHIVIRSDAETAFQLRGAVQVRRHFYR